MESSFDVIIRNGRWFDGTGAPSAVRHLGIRQGRVEAVSSVPLPEEGCPEILDAQGKWVLPGFVDIHTHYDAEILAAPGLRESVRHGVTSVFLGSCSIGTVHSSALDCADLFSRVEAVPRQYVLALLERHKTWQSAGDYVRFLESMPLGPNVAAFLGHSDIRAHVMGLGRSVDPKEKPTEEEMRRMEQMLDDAISQGFLGLSTMTNPWDKLDGERYRSKSLPSTFAHWAEYQRFNQILRATGRVLQSAPNITTKVNAVRFLWESMALFGRKALKTTLLTAADAKSSPFLVRLLCGVARFINRFTGANFRWQHLPVPFEVYADGIDLVVFEEFGAGRAALHLQEEVERNRLLTDTNYRREFRRDYEAKFTPRVWQRDFHDAHIVACPDASVVGKSFGQVADERGIHPVDAFLDLVVEHGTKVRWRTTIANHRTPVLDQLAADSAVQMGFADSGAHLRNMAFYNFPIRMLRRVKAAIDAGNPFMTLERAVHRLTGELGGWYGVHAGTLRKGDRADIVVVDPAGLDASVDAYYEAPVPEYGGLSRMVNRSDAAVKATLVGGRVVYQNGQFLAGYGETLRTGSFLRVGESSTGDTVSSREQSGTNEVTTRGGERAA